MRGFQITKGFTLSKLIGVVVPLLFLSILLPIPVVSGASLSADSGGPYEVWEENSIVLDGSGSSGPIENYVWSITDDPTGEAYLENSARENAVLHAPEVDNDMVVKVELKVIDENEKSDGSQTSVTIKDRLIAVPEGPYDNGPDYTNNHYEVREGETLELNGSQSSGYIDNYRWVIVDDPTGDSFLKNADTENPTFHPPSRVPKNENVRVKLTVFSGDNSDSATTTITVIDPPVADLGGPYSVFEDGSIGLEGGGSDGYDNSEVEEYTWTIVEDPSGEAYLDDADKEEPTFYPPPEIGQDMEVIVGLTIEDGAGESDSDNVKVTVMDDLIAIPGGPYQVEAGNTVTLDGTQSSGYIDSYSWVIRNDPTGGCRLTENTTPAPAFHAPDSISQNRSVEVSLTVIDFDPREGDNLDSATTTVNVVDPPVADSGGPYSMEEDDTLILDGGQSSGSDGSSVTSYSWNIVDDPKEEVYLENSDEESSVLHAPKVENDTVVKVRLIITDGNGKTDGTVTTVTVEDSLIADPGADRGIESSENIELDGTSSSGYIDDYSWVIVEDSTEESRLVDAFTPTPMFYSPSEISRTENILVRLTVTSGSYSDSENLTVTVSPVPSPPEIMEPNISGTIADPVPSFSCVYSDDMSPATKAQIQVWPGGSPSEMWDYTETGLDVPSENRYYIEYGGSPLVPGENYYWRMRYYDENFWSDWLDNTSFGMGAIKSVIETGVEEAHDGVVAEILVQVGFSEAADGLSDADSAASAKVLERVFLQNPSAMVEIMENMGVEERATMLTEISGLPSTPEKAAQILDTIPNDMAAETIQVIIERNEFGVLDDIFHHLAPSQIDNYFAYEMLTENQKSSLYSNLSSDIQEEISFEPGAGGTNWLLIVGIVVAICTVGFIGLSFYNGGKTEKEGGDEKWIRLIKKFLESGKGQMAIKTDIPPEEVLKSAQSAIQRGGGEDLVRAERRGDKVYLVRK